MSHFTTAVSLSGVAQTWSRSTLQSFQDLWKYPLHVFSCMWAWVRGLGGFYALIPTVWMQLIIDGRWFKTEKIHPFFCVCFVCLFCLAAKIVWQRTLLTGVNTSIYLSVVTLYVFAEHYQRWYLFICVESEIGTTVKAQMVWQWLANIGLSGDGSAAGDLFADDKPHPRQVCSYMGILSVFFCFHRQHRQPRLISAFLWLHTVQYIECSLYISPFCIISP